MSSKANHHQRAMDLVEAAMLERMHGNSARTEELYAEALELELAAIGELEREDDRGEPTWSVLHRSAGWMAFNSNQPRRAEQLAAKALAGDPHPEIAEELRDLLEQVYARWPNGPGTAGNGNENLLSTDAPASEALLPPGSSNKLASILEPEAVEVRGVLRYADGIRANVIRIVEDSGKDRAVAVPEGMMNEIVRPNWGERVRITGTELRGEITLQKIVLDDGDS